MYSITVGRSTAFATPCGTWKYALTGWLIACTFPSFAHANAIPANVDPVIIAHAASSSCLFATKRRIFAPISSIAFSAIASVNGDAKLDTYASNAWISASTPQEAAIDAGAVIISCGSRTAYFGNIS